MRLCHGWNVGPLGKQRNNQTGGDFRPCHTGGGMKTGRQQPAIVRAEQLWGECNLHVRALMRDRAVVGALPRLDRYVAGDRGTGYVRFLADFARHVMDVSQGRITPDELAAELNKMSDGIVRAVADERPGAA